MPTNQKYDFSIVIGRFQPVHNGHVELLRKAFELAPTVIAIVGSAIQPRTIKNPFLHYERVQMIHNMVSQFPSIRNRYNLICKYVTDTMYNDQTWAENVQNAIDETLTKQMLFQGCAIEDIHNFKICLVGHHKDSQTNSSLDMFPQWDSIEVDAIAIVHGNSRARDVVLNATTIRNELFGTDLSAINNDQPISWDNIYNHVPESTNDFLKMFVKTKAYKNLREEYKFLKMYKGQWANSPYPPTFVTVDTIVIQSGHILLVKRRSAPGKGLFAIPGGYLDSSELIIDSALRELKEETKIDVPSKVLRGLIKETHVFDAVDRSLRGRTITHAHLIVLPAGELPKVTSSNETTQSIWMPLSSIKYMRDKLFEDHYDIITYFMGRA